MTSQGSYCGSALREHGAWPTLLCWRPPYHSLHAEGPSTLSDNVAKKLQPKAESRELGAMALCEDPEQEVKGDAREEQGIEDPEDQVGLPTSETAFWNLTIEELSWIGRWTWASMPVTFALSWYGSPIYLYAFVCSKFCLVSILQYAIRSHVHVHLQHMRANRRDLVALDNARQPWLPAQWSAWDVVAAAGKLLAHLFFLALDLSEIVDPDMDAMTPGNTKRVVREDDAAEYSNSWVSVPFIGACISHLGLPGVLTVGLVIVAIWQIYLFEMQRRLVLKFTRDHPRGLFYFGLYTFADSGNLLVFASQAKRLWFAVDSEVAAFGGFRIRGYQSRVPELLFQGWFSVSALVFALHRSVTGIAPVAFSVATSVGTSTKLLIEMAIRMKPLHYHHYRDNPNIPWYKSAFVRTAAVLACHTMGYIAISLRLFGIAFCHGHDFYLSTLECALATHGHSS